MDYLDVSVNGADALQKPLQLPFLLRSRLQSQQRYRNRVVVSLGVVASWDVWGPPVVEVPLSVDHKVITAI